MAFNKTWLGNTWLDGESDTMDEVDDYANNIGEALTERLSGILYGFASDGSETDDAAKGFFKLPLKEQASDPSNESGKGILYTKDVSGVTELFYEDSDGNVKQLTTGGKLNIASDEAVLLSGNQTINGVKTFGSILVLPASDPSNDNEATRKKYVDDEISSHVTARHAGNKAVNKNSSTVSTSSTSWTDLLTVSITTNGNPVFVSANVSHTGADGEGQLDEFQIRLVRDTTDLGVYSEVKPDDHKGGCNVCYIDTPSSGSYTYKVQGKCVGQVGSGFSADAGFIHIIAFELGY